MAVTRNPNLGPSLMRARRRRLFWVRFSIVLFFLLIIVFSLAIYSGSEKIIIKNIAVSGNAAVSADEVLTIVNRDLAGRYWYLFARKNFLIFPRFQIKEDILREIKTVKEVDISWDGWQKIAINLVERRPHSVWCGFGQETPAQSCFFLDKDGFIYSLAPDFSGTMFIRSYGGISTSTDPLGQVYLSSDTYRQFFVLAERLESFDQKVVSIIRDDFDYHFILASGPEIIFNDDRSFVSSFSNLFIALETGNLDLKNEAAKIKYVDLRFDNKIVVGKNEMK